MWQDKYVYLLKGLPCLVSEGNDSRPVLSQLLLVKTESLCMWLTLLRFLPTVEESVTTHQRSLAFPINTHIMLGYDIQLGLLQKVYLSYIQSQQPRESHLSLSKTKRGFWIQNLSIKSSPNHLTKLCAAVAWLTKSILYTFAIIIH